MELDYNAGTKSFIFRVPRGSALVQTMMREHGLDFSLPASTAQTAVLFTHEPYAALPFYKHATTAAFAQLEAMIYDYESSFAQTSAARIKCPADRELWPFQIADVEYALRRKHTLIGDQPGLGKTPVAICYANEIGARHVLVICPANIRLQWARRIREWTTMRWPCVVFPVMSSKRGVGEGKDQPHWTIVSYELARTEGIANALARNQYDLLIIDEAHYLKTIDSRRTRAVFGGGERRTFEPLASRAGSILALTGTPLPNRPREAYTLARALCFDAIDWASEDKFNERFNPSVRREVVDPVTGRTKFYIDERTGRHAELQARLRVNFMARHLKRDVMTQLKLPIYDLIQVEETGAVKQALKAESLLDIDPENLAGADMTTLGHIAVARRMMGLAMAPQVADYVDMLLDGGETKVTLFAWHIEVMNILEKALAKWGVIRVDGRHSGPQKEKRVQEFVTGPAQVMLGNMLAMGVGTDGLQEVSSHALIAEPDWAPGNNLQAFDRLDRGGQRGQVQGDIFVAPKSIAEKVLATALRKLDTTDRALDRRIA